MLVSHGKSKSIVYDRLFCSKTNVSIAAKKASMASIGVIPGPIDSILVNHPDRGSTKNSKSRQFNPNWDSQAQNGLSQS